jgi:hypothetical protein
MVRDLLVGLSLFPPFDALFFLIILISLNLAGFAD